MHDERLIDLEFRLARQEDMIEALNETVYRQQKKLDELEALCSALARHLRDMRDASAAGPANEKPPHY
jgi:SlyX protein